MRSSKLKAVLIDDEEYGCGILSQLIDEYCPEVDVLAKTEDIQLGKDLIQTHQPDVVFLDVDVPQGSGLELINSLPVIDFDFVITTAHSGYALEAFKVAATDYLVKPIHPGGLIRAVNRVVQKREKQAENDQLLQTINQLMAQSLMNCQPVGIPTLDGVEYFEPREILYCVGEGSYTEVYLHNGKKLVLSKSIGQVEKILGDSLFFRIHNSRIVNLRCIRKYVKNGSGYVILKDGSHVDISRRRRDDFLERMRIIQPRSS